LDFREISPPAALSSPEGLNKHPDAARQQGVIMTRLMFSTVVSMTVLWVAAFDVRACNPACRGGRRPAVGAPVRQTPIAVAPGGEDEDDSLVWDLPDGKVVTTKRPTTPAATPSSRRTGSAGNPGRRAPAPGAVPDRRPVEAVEEPAEDEQPEAPAARTTAAPKPASVDGASYADRMTRAVAARQTLVAQNARLDGKRRELLRWGSEDQEKFRRAFGSTDEQLRRAVLQRIEQQQARNRQLMAAIADGMNFDFYIQTKKPR
jgi:hypothetical protein